MKFSFCALNFALVTFLVSCQKDDDESRPYEFGFTIDGQQHRHEKKDVNGIIQGEFGFITADGIYHVTVYATDENGNFRILSMKNIRISAPLDGSPLPEGQKIAPNPMKSSAPPARGQPPGPQTGAPAQQTITRAPAGPFAFTTQSTLKPACGGCGYVTTPKPIPGQPFPFQTPAFQLQNNQNGQKPARFQSGLKQGGQNQNIPPNSPQRGSQGLNQITNQRQSQSNENSPNELSKPNQGPQENQHSLGGSQQDFKGSNQQPLSFTGQNGPPQSSQLLTHDSDGGNLKGKPHNPVTNPLSEVAVTDGVIKVPGNPDIPIKDKYPGMSDGLPNDIEEKDITDLLYKFHYTVGFHGHYEMGLKSGAKVGGYFVNGRDGVSRVVTYVADENGFRPKVKFIRLGLDSPDTPNEATEKNFGLKSFEFVWYPIS